MIEERHTDQRDFNFAANIAIRSATSPCCAEA